MRFLEELIRPDLLPTTDGQAPLFDSMFGRNQPITA